MIKEQYPKANEEEIKGIAYALKFCKIHHYIIN